MKKKLTEIMGGKSDYKWTYCSLGGVTRVNITSGADIAHLAELDQKMWTVLSCPVKGLELDERTLDLIDYDRDGKIRVDEVITASQWLCKVLNNPDKILLGQDFIELDDFNTENEEGAQLKECAAKVIQLMGLEKNSISLPELNDFLAHYDDDCQKALEASLGALAVDDAPYGANSDDAVAAVDAVKDKIADYFMRCKFIQFHSESTAALDVNAEKVAAISEKNLATCVGEISTYPISRPIASCVLPINEGINPAWQAAFGKVKTLVLDVDYPEKESLTEAEWNACVAKCDAYVASKADKTTAINDEQSAKVTEEHDAIKPLERLLHLNRDFYTLLRNYVMMSDFYDRSKDAIFQAGKLYIDSRCLNLCMRVSDAAKHLNDSRISGMFLVYCTCTSRVKNATMNIVAVLTDGDLDNLRVGKNAVFYDRSGQDWDAVVTHILDNPISIRQAFWSPYKKIGTFITEKINKSAAEKEAKQMEEMTAKADGVSLSGENKEGQKKQAFDIAKFAGIFAAIGMAIGFITSALTGLLTTFFKNPISMVLFVVLIMLCVSGPSMFIAWSKLRKRNLGPVLNANGWAVNAKIVVNTRFGATLTELSHFPKVVLDDPFAEKKMPKWLRWLISFFVCAAAIFLLMYFNNFFGHFEKAKALHYDESSIVYRITHKVTNSVKEGLAETVEGMNSSLAAADSTAAASAASAAEMPAPAAE
ncbi:MAG: hypothetical protein MJZ86_05925 [Bacteroidales bacterium]|nr:hypothetical protein [Bacteroidales bacterium]